MGGRKTRDSQAPLPGIDQRGTDRGNSRGRHMSSTQAPAPVAQSPRRWRRRLIVGIVAVLGVGVGGFAFLFYHEADLEQAVAEADRLDPGWRLEEMEAARAAVPDAENGAVLVLAAHPLIPARWLFPPPDDA